MLAVVGQDRTVRWALFAFIALAILGAFLPAWVQDNIMFGLARGLAVLGLMVLWRTGLISFGHALYFGIGAYAVALIDHNAGVTDIFVRLILAAGAAAVVGFGLGFILRKYRSIFFAMLSLAFSMVLYGILVKVEALGSTDGFSVSRTTILGWAPETKYALFVTVIALLVVPALYMIAEDVRAWGRSSAVVTEGVGLAVGAD